MVFKRVRKDSWSSRHYIAYYVLVENSKGPNIIYYYRDMPLDKDTQRIDDKQVIRPEGFFFADANDFNGAVEAAKSQGHFGGSEKYVVVSGEPEDTCLYVPEMYKRAEIKFVNNRDPEIPDEAIERASEITMSTPMVLVGENYANGVSGKRIELSYEYYCSKCKKFFYPRRNSPAYGTLSCQCGNLVGNDTVAMKEFKDFRAANYCVDSYGKARISESTVKKDRYFYVRCEDIGVIVYRISRDFIAEKNTISEKYSIEYSIEHFVGKKTVAYKHLKNGKRECDPFEALNINSKTIRGIPNVIYEGAEDFFEFANKNEKFMRMSGFLSVLKYSTLQLNLPAFFIVFLGIMNKYPVMEQIVKMGHARLFFMLYQNLLDSGNKIEIDNNVEKISQLVDNEATKGKDALRFPFYIGDYLLKKNAGLEEYYYWRDVYEITHITKEQFENFVESFNFGLVNSQVGMADVGNILKFGYPIDKLFNYIIKQSKACKTTVPNIIQNMVDYLNMCDMLRVEADKYPQNVIKQHDDIIEHYNRQKVAMKDKVLAKIGDECERYVIPDEEELDKIGIPKLFSKMTVVFPRSERDFINEGNQQHNCVGSYPDRVRQGRCVVFFIREKSNVKKSFITAECTRGGLGQCFYSNNRTVHDEELIKFARYIANKIKSGCISGKIHALQNIKK